MAQRASKKKSAVDLPEFEQIVRLIRRMIDIHAIWVKFSLSRLVEFVVEREPFDIIVSTSGFPREAVQQVLDDDLAAMVGAVLTGETAAYIKMKARPDEDDEAKDSKLKERLAIVEQHLVTDQLRKRYEIKTDLVRDIFCDCEWQVDYTVATSRNDKESERVPLVSLRLMSQRRPLVKEGGLAQILSTIVGNNLTDVGASFDLDADDLDYLIAVLHRARAAMSDARTAGGN